VRCDGVMVRGFDVCVFGCLFVLLIGSESESESDGFEEGLMGGIYIY